MTIPSAARAALLAVATSLMAMTGSVPAQAASSHHGTLPYETGCAASRQLVQNGVRAVPGGTIRVYYSPVCGTNWVEYRGIAQMSAKQVTSSLGYTREVDYTSYAYSKQVYAPGTSKIYVNVFGPGWSAGADCAVSCGPWH